MRRQPGRWLLFIQGGVLLSAFVTAIANGSRANWLAVAVVALLFALTLVLRARAAGK